MPMNATQLRPGMIIVWEGQLCQVMKCQHRTPGNLRAFMQATLRNLKVGNQYEVRFSPSDSLEEVRLDERPMQYLYAEGDQWVFMDTQNYEQIHLSKELLKDVAMMILPDSVVKVTFHEGKAFGVNLPKTVDLKVTSTEPSIKGATASASYKPATLETGLVVKVPPFIQEGEIIRVDTDTKEYLERAKS
ncbi:MAG: elongation factor P [Deltaproteobacteria bacterium]|nr:elongation factor P [Deltaproteobacteria bacterium]